MQIKLAYIQSAVDNLLFCFFGIREKSIIQAIEVIIGQEGFDFMIDRQATNAGIEH